MSPPAAPASLAAVRLWVCLWAAGSRSTVAAQEPSPCAGKYADWVTDPSVFVRRDEPKHMQGLHVVCIWRPEVGGAALALEAYKNAVDTGEPPLRRELRASTLESWRDFRKELQTALGFTKRSNGWGYLELKQPFGIFSSSGKRLASGAEVLEAQLVLITEGGQWFWPPLRKGFVRQIDDGLVLETMAVQPVLFRVRGFLKPEECTEIVDIAQGRMFNSPVSLMDKDKGKAAKEFRTSTQARVGPSESKYLHDINDRITRLTRVPLNHNEEVQILRYEKTQYYAAHLDNWDPKYYSGQDTSFMEHGHNNRIITVFWYLTNVSGGGETLFPRADGLPSPADSWSCDKGLKVQPEQGAVIFWYSLRPNGNTDENGVHAACPVATGEKWSANYWVWNKPRGFDSKRMPDQGVDEEDVAASEGPDQRTPDGHVAVTFVNRHHTEPLDAFYVDDQGTENNLGVVQPGGKMSMNSFVGHRWVFRTQPGRPPWKTQVKIHSKGEVQTHDLTPPGSDDDSESRFHDEA